jgi:LruC domain-containing protein
MKQIKIRLLIALALTLTLSFSSCNDKITDFSPNDSSLNFDFKTIKEVNVSISTLNNNNEPLPGVYVEIYSQNPLDENGGLIANRTDFLLQKGLTDATGLLSSTIAPATTVDSLVVLVNQIGLQSYHSVKLTSNNIKLTIGGNNAQSKVKYKAVASTSAIIPPVSNVDDFFVLGGWNKSGVPNYLLADDLISNDFLVDVNASLPERVELSTSHPEYLNSSDNGNLVLDKDAEVWVTFVHEGAGYLNTLAYYTYPNGNAPKKSKDITDKTIIFPNASFSGSGGGMNSGNKVQLFYYNPTKKSYTNIFPAGTTVSWIIRSNGWTGSAVGTGYNNFYSDKNLNPEKNTENQKHNVVLKDLSRQIYLVGFEDLNRETGNSDNDFNDVVIYATVTPFDAVNESLYKAVDSKIKDKDNDGVPDDKDEYPEDKSRAFNNYYPAKSQTGTLAFEDLWPSKGDYDFNDMIVDYNYNQITNGANKVVAVYAELTPRAKGAHYSNAFGIEFNTTPENVKSVTGQSITNGYLNIGSNGTENNQSKAVVIAFDNAYDFLKTYNTIIGQTYYTPKTLKINIEFVTPIDPIAFGSAPYNPFIIINKTRGKEVHLPTLAPTSLADLSLLGTVDDNSNIALGKYYTSDKYLPWAINIPVTFDYPAEKEDIRKAFLFFNKWSESKGLTNKDWYVNKDGFRDLTKIYHK